MGKTANKGSERVDQEIFIGSYLRGTRRWVIFYGY